MQSRRVGSAFLAGVALLALGGVAFAWDPPPQNPPNNNVLPPINTSSSDQAKSGGLDLGGLLEAGALFINGGDAIIAGLTGGYRYLNFGATAGDAGYGIRNSNGTMQYKNAADGSWSNIGSAMGLTWSASGNNIYNANTGNVGVNAPSPAYRLDVNPNAADAISGRIGPAVLGTMGHGASYAGFAHSAMATSNNYGFLQQSNGTTYVNTALGGSIRFREGNTDRMVMSGTSLGIGTFTPTIRLAIGDSDTGFQWVSDGNFALYTNNAERIRFNSSGNVGIGNTAPAQKLHVTGNVRADGFCIGTDCITTWGTGSIGGTGTTNYVPKFTAASTIGNSQIFDNGTNVGIGTASPSGKLHVNGTMLAASSIRSNHSAGVYNPNNSGAEAFLGWANDIARIRIGGTGVGSTNGLDIQTTGDVSLMRLQHDGKVGIGTASPGHRLTVQGPATTNVDAIRATVGILNSSTYAVMGIAGTYWGALGRGDGYAFVGNGDTYASGTAYANSFVYISDQRLKENIAPLGMGLEEILQLKPVSYTWKDGADLAGQDDFGLIAQEVESVIPGAIQTRADGYKAVDYPRLIPVLVKALQEQQAEIDALKAEVAAIKESQ